MNKFCQSCGMPLNKDPGHGGTLADGSKTDEYCSLCYQNGVFFQPDLNAKEMQAFCIEKMTEQGMSKIVAWLFTRGIPRLRRWTQSTT